MPTNTTWGQAWKQASLCLPLDWLQWLPIYVIYNMSVILSWNRYWLIDCEHTGKLWRLIMIEWQWWFLQRCQEDIGNRHVETWSFWWFWWWWWRQLLVTCVMELEYYSLVNLRTEGAVVTDWPSWKRRGLKDFFSVTLFSSQELKRGGSGTWKSTGVLW